MKSQRSWKWSLGLGLVVLPWVAVSGRAQSNPNAPVPVFTNNTPTAVQSTAAQPPGPAAAAAASPDTPTDTQPSPDEAIANAPVQSLGAERPLPANLSPTGPLAEVIKLANAGVDPSVILAFITNSTSLFDLGAEDIIYLNDIGVPSQVITAMLQHDQALKGPGAAIAATPPMETNPVPAPDGTAPGPPNEVGPVAVAPPGPQPAVVYPAQPPPPAVEVTDAGFYDALAPYGSWVNLEGYGPCWQPTAVVANPGWQPYFDSGHWVYTDCGWYWLSDYSWGWAPFHYGRWFRHNRLGWCWAPDRVWGPSWVAWRYGDAYCGWAPLPPGCQFTFGIGLTFRGRRLRDHDDCGLRPDRYRFVAWQHFRERELHQHGLPARQVGEAYRHSTVATGISGDRHTVMNRGLPVSKVAAATRAPVHPVALREASGPAPRIGRAEQFNSNGRTLQVYRPRLAETTQRRITPAASPGRVPANSPRLFEAPGSSPTRSLTKPAPEQVQRSVPNGTRNAPAAIRPQVPRSTVTTLPANRPQAVNPSARSTTATPWLQGNAERPQAPASTRQAVPGFANTGPTRVAPAQDPPARPTVNPYGQRPAVPAPAPSATPYNSVPRQAQPAPRYVSPQPAPRYQTPAPAYPAPAPSYRVPERNVPAPVPRYTPTPSYRAPEYQAPRSYSPPPAAAPSRSYESRPAPAAPPASSSSSGGSRSSGPAERQTR